MRTARWILVIVAAVGLAIAAPRRAEACGGCFGPVDTPQVVTDHRMVMAIHANEAILWDQIRYTGRPEDFSWVLPVSGDVRVEIAAGEFFDWLESSTSIRVQGPNPPQCPGNARFSAGFSPSTGEQSSSDVGQPPVQVLRTEVVGPYQTVVLRSADSNALVTWLRSNNYAIPAPIMPTIQWYVERHMDFVALRLRPGEGVSAMQPIRIRYAGMNTILPLRMVAAGVGDKVGILLWVFASGRYEAGNFINREIDPNELVWNWNTNRSNYQEVFENAIRAGGGRVWVTENASSAQSVGWRFGRGFRGSSQPDPISDAARDDWNLATQNSDPSVWLTRMRTDLLVQYLDNDLTLRPSSGSTLISSYFATRTIGTPPQPVCAPGRSGLGFGLGGAGFVCAARPAQRAGSKAFVISIAALCAGVGLVAVRRRGRRARRGASRE